MEQIPFPDIKIFSLRDAAAKIGHFVFDHIRTEVPSEHFRGAEADLDAALYDQVPPNRWDSEGRYFEE